MSNNAYILHASEGLAARAGETARAAGDRTQPVVLALPSEWCLAATIDITGLPRNDRRASIFRLEDKLPLAAEDVTADIVPHGKHALGVCVRNDRIANQLIAMESSGVMVQSIAPSALLAAQAVVDDSGSYVLLIGGEGAVDIVAVEEGAPVSWAWSAANLDDIRLQIDLVSIHLAATPRIVAVGVTDVILDELADGTRRPLATKIDRTVDELMAVTAQRIVEGRIKPWIDLRRDALAPADRGRTHRRALNFALASAALLLLSIATASVIRSVRYNQAARAAESEMITAFQERFPDWPVPANVRAVVESERRKGVAGASAAGDASALDSMRRVLGAVPSQVKVSLDSMSFDHSTFELSGRVNDQAGLQALADAARAAGYVVPPAVNRREPDGTWSFTLSGTRRSSGRAQGGAVAQQGLD